MIQRILHAAQEHPYTVGLIALGTVAGGVGGAFLPVDASLAARVLGGSIAGFYFALFPLGERLFD